MKEILKEHGGAVCRALNVQKLRDLENAFGHKIRDSKVSALCRSIESMPTVASVEWDKEWDNVLSELIRIRFRFDSRKNQKLFVVVRLSKVAPIACISWMTERQISGFGGLPTTFVAGCGFPGRLNVTEKSIHQQLCDIICVNGYFVVLQKSLLFNLKNTGAPDGKTDRISGAELYFGWKFNEKKG
jgi:hypothetical protein